ncbi:MAG: serine hydrolase [Ignavibacteria bacterium]|nr:serine hydrolase [Ignavibacteria bacterium]
MHNKILSLIFVLFSFINIYSQTEIPSFITDSLDAYVEKALTTWQIPGVAVCVVKDGEVVVMKGYGVCEEGKNDKVDENTLFMIGSNTKAFTTTALAMLEHDGKCAFDDKVQKWLPDFTMKDPWVTKELNLTDIVSHRMGMETFQGDFMYWTSDLTMDEVIRKFGQLTPMYSFRTTWGYTNAGYAIAGKIIEKISGKTWSEFLKERIISPLNMNRTLALSEEIKNAENVAAPHTTVDGVTVPVPIPDIDNLAPAGSISSSVKDMSNWLIAQLNNGKLDEEEIIPPSVIKKTRQPSSIVRRISHPFNKQHYSLYALGWGLEDYEGRELVEHTGGVNGFVTSVTLVPEENLGVVVLTNTGQNGLFVALKWEIIDAFLGLPYRNYSETFFERFGAGRKNEEKRTAELRDSVDMDLTPSLALNDYSGRYLHDVYGYIDITRNGDLLEMSFEHHSNLKGKLESLGENRFLCTYSDPMYGIRVIPFVTEGNKVKSFTLSVHPFVEFTTYDFVKN